MRIISSHIYCMMAIFFIMATAGCIDEPKTGAPVQFRLLSSGGLDANQTMGLYAGSPVNVSNAPFKVGANGRVILDKEIHWAFGQSVGTHFTAYSPYDPSYTGADILTVEITNNQSTPELIKRADIMMATASGSPKLQSVNLRMKHAMTALFFSLDNRTGSDVESVLVSGPLMSAKLDFLTGTLASTGKKQWIEPLRSSPNGNSYMLLYPPQDVSIMIVVTLKSGKEISMTFDKPCRNYPEMVLDLGVIVLDEKMPDHNILSLDGVGLSKWDYYGLPSFPVDDSYITLSQLDKVEPDEDGFFAAYLHKVTVTAVDKRSEYGYGVILEDSTDAIHAWLYYEDTLMVGNTITGPVLGYMDKPADDELHISYLYLSYATLGKTDTLPCTKGSFESVAANPAKYEYRRMLFENVTLKESFAHDRAVFVQDGVEMSVVCPDLETKLMEGVTGNLVGFPVLSGRNDVYIKVYDEGQLKVLSKESNEDSFTAMVQEGLYEITESESPRHITACSKNGGQTATSNYGNDGYSMQITDTNMGRLWYCYIYGNCKTVKPGHVYTVSCNASDTLWGDAFTANMECVKVTEDRVWLVDMSGTYGIVVVL